MSTGSGSIEGRVVGATGAPVSGATVAVVAGAQPHRDVAAITSANGTFRFSGMPPGTYRVEARSRGIVGSAEVTVAANAPAGVEIRLDG